MGRVIGPLLGPSIVHRPRPRFQSVLRRFFRLTNILPSHPGCISQEDGRWHALLSLSDCWGEREPPDQSASLQHAQEGAVIPGTQNVEIVRDSIYRWACIPYHTIPSHAIPSHPLSRGLKVAAVAESGWMGPVKRVVQLFVASRPRNGLHGCSASVVCRSATRWL